MVIQSFIVNSLSSVNCREVAPMFPNVFWFGVFIGPELCGRRFPRLDCRRCVRQGRPGRRTTCLDRQVCTQRQVCRNSSEDRFPSGAANPVSNSGVMRSTLASYQSLKSSGWKPGRDRGRSPATRSEAVRWAPDSPSPGSPQCGAARQAVQKDRPRAPFHRVAHFRLGFAERLHIVNEHGVVSAIGPAKTASQPRSRASCAALPWHRR